MTRTPALVERAVAAAVAAGFPLRRDGAEDVAGRGSASLPGVGQFLAVLAAGCRGGRIAEFGTGTGIGTAWLASAMPADCTLVTAEIDPARAVVAAGIFAADPRVRVLTGDAQSLLAPLAPFDLIFTDCGGGADAGGDAGPGADAGAGPGGGAEAGPVSPFASRVGLLKPGGQIVADDVTPVLALPAGSPFREHDPKRAQWAADGRLVWTEVVLPDLANSLLVGTRTG